MKILGNILGIIMLLAGLGYLTSGNVLSSLFYIAGGLVALSWFRDFVANKWNIKIPKAITVTLAVLGLIIGGLLAMPSTTNDTTKQTLQNNSNSTEIDSQEATQENSAEEEDLSESDKQEISDRISDALIRSQDEAFEEIPTDIETYTENGVFDQDAYQDAIRQTSEREQVIYAEYLQQIADEYSITSEEAEAIWDEINL